jgi:hypothetical protein
MTNILVQGSPNSYINRIGARIYMPYGTFNGLAFEFSDGSKRVFSISSGDYSTDPYQGDSDYLATRWLDAPNGFDQLTYGLQNATCGDLQLVSLDAYLHNTLVGSIRVGSPYANKTGNLSVPYGEIASSIMLKVVESCGPYAITPDQLFGKKAPIDGIWSDWSNYTACSSICGPATQYRTRRCTQPLNGGHPCDGASIETIDCNQGPCAHTDDPASNPVTASGSVSGGAAATSLPIISTPIANPIIDISKPSISINYTYLLMIVAFIFICIMYTNHTYPVTIQNVPVAQNI